ncbi:DUF2325 domain-containing protein [Caldimonas tepidiphila]|uniref:DUF2325 domain-containing protein n=1 Tax=Caldimonas tepidiphila TaxID=2315841 RepID=UPI001F0C8537|nr:DUF2325 domain-containing protein [Caldimonas tepidiphila]
MGDKDWPLGVGMAGRRRRRWQEQEAARRVELQRHAELVREHGVLLRELAAAQQRCSRAITAGAACIAEQEAQLVRLRGELIVRDTLVAVLRDALAGFPALASCASPRPADDPHARIAELERELAHWRRQALGSRPEAGGTPGPAQPHNGEPLPPHGALGSLRDKAVLWVGTGAAALPACRRLVECTGGRFLHHDGADAGPATQLETSLAAADLVICQTGCLSHDAFWRVEDHCRRHGKRCVLVDTAGAASLAQGLHAVPVHRAVP